MTLGGLLFSGDAAAKSRSKSYARAYDKSCNTNDWQKHTARQESQDQWLAKAHNRAIHC